jgi:hypothetical protein
VKRETTQEMAKPLLLKTAYGDIPMSVAHSTKAKQQPRKSLAELSKQSTTPKHRLDEEKSALVEKKRRLNKEEEEEDDYYEQEEREAEEENFFGQFNNLEERLGATTKGPLEEALRVRVKALLRLQDSVSGVSNALEVVKGTLSQRQAEFEEGWGMLESVVDPAIRVRDYEAEWKALTNKRERLVAASAQRFLALETRRIRDVVVAERRCLLPNATLRALFPHLNMTLLLGRVITHEVSFFYGEEEGYVVFVCHMAKDPVNSPYVMLRSERLRVKDK